MTCMKNALRTTLTLCFLAAFGAGLFYAVPAFAQTLTDAQMFGGGLTGSEFAEVAGLGGGDLRVVIARLIRTVLTFLGIVTVGIILYGGFVYMMSKGEAAKVDKAKKIIINGVVGLVIVFSSFAITQFVLNSLVNAIQGEEATPAYCLEHPTDVACAHTDLGDPAKSFFITGTTTECAEGLRNPLIQLQFNAAVDLSTVPPTKNGVTIEVTSGDDVPGAWTASGNTLTFTPEANCSDIGYPEVHCFPRIPEGAKYEISVQTTVLKSASGLSLACSTQYPCAGNAFEFTVGTGVDLTAPTVSMQDPTTGDSVISGAAEPLQARTIDDSGVVSVQFYVEGDDVDTAGIADSLLGAITPAPAENFFNGTWPTSGYVIGQTYSLWAVGSDCGGNETTSASVEIPLRAPSCDNKVQDSGTPYLETGVDCGGAGQYFCGNCPGTPCVDDADCASGECVDGVCVASLEIEQVSPGDGGYPNLISIIGHGFGTTPGTVTLLGVEDVLDDQNASVYSSSYCPLNWTDELVVVQLNEDSVDGPISLQTSAGKTDRTDDDNGSRIADFDVNDVVRPGICQVNPSSAKSETQVVVSGIGLGTGDGLPAFYFGSTASDQLANWNAGGETFSALIPLLDAGSYTTQYFYGIGADRQGSNTLPFTVLATAEVTEPPVISQIDTGVSACSNSHNVCATDDDCTGVSLPDGVCAMGCEDSSVCDPSRNECENGDPCYLFCPDGTSCTVAGETCYATSSGTCNDVSGTSGPVGQYVTIYGTNFGDVQGAVLFTNNITDADSQGFQAYGDSEFPPYCDVDTWTDNMIVVKVPATYNLNYDPNADPPEPPLPFESGAHTLFVERGTDGRDSNAVDFTVLSGDAGPSICGLTPTSGPVGTMVTIAGERFGLETDGSVMFMDTEVTEAADEPLTWSDTTIIGYVPDGAQTGEVRVISDGNRSNPVNYSVGVCDEDFTCGTGEECCSNGACAVAGQQCELPPGEAYYAYFFSTDEIPVTPEVVTDCSGDAMSPTPWEGYDDDICLTATVSATFNTDMDPDSLTGSNIQVVKCADADCTAATATPVTMKTAAPGSEEPMVSDTSYGTSSKFVWTPAAAFQAGQHYRVTLNGGNESGAIMSALGVAMESDYSWDFYTTAAGTNCTIGSVNVSPSDYTATTFMQTVAYGAAVSAEGFECVMMNCAAAGLSWTWKNTPAYATNNPAKLTANGCSATEMAYYETPAASPVVVSATENSSSIADTGTLNINFTSPMVTDYSPDCSSSCTNTTPKVKFNVVLNTAYMNGYTSPSPSFYIYKCADAICNCLTASCASNKVPYSYTYNSTASEVTLTPTSSLLPDTYYRVVVSGSLRVGYMTLLSEAGANYGTNFSWVFKTSDAACTVDRIGVSPEEQTFSYIGERGEFSAQAYSAPDECENEGQAINAGDAKWDPWTVENPAVADVWNSDTDLETLPEWCTSDCLRAGSPSPSAMCGNHVVEWNSATGGEDCDGGSAGCSSSSCLYTGSTLTTCGNKTPDTGEECDNGKHCSNGTACTSSTTCAGIGDLLCKTRDGDGCSATCLNEGSVPSCAGCVCGNGTRDWNSATGGEDCDDGNTSSGDGCSSTCLNEGSEPVPYAVCGNNVKEVGEDCDDGHTVSGDGCSSTCLNEGTLACSPSVVSNCCGNGPVPAGQPQEAHEDCDDGNKISGDGCSGICLYEGSSHLYTPISVCGDGVTDAKSEECDATGPVGSAGPYAITVIENTAPALVDETTKQVTTVLTATTNDGKIGTADLTLECSCSDDASCGEIALMGCGQANCCFERPDVIIGGMVPANATGVCRNAAVSVTFSQEMDEESFIEVGETTVNRRLYLQLLGFDSNHNGRLDTEDTNGNGTLDTGEDADSDGLLDTGESVTANSCPASHETVAFEGANRPLVSEGGDFGRAFGWLARGVTRVFMNEAQAIVPTGTVCLLPTTYEVEETTYTVGTAQKKGWKVLLRYSEALQEYGIYQLVAEGQTSGTGVSSVYGVEMYSPESTTFVTKDEICELEYVEVEDQGKALVSAFDEPSPGVFSELDEEHSLTATAYTLDGALKEEIIGIPGVYDWTWGWNGTDNAVIDVPVAPTSTQNTATAKGNGDITAFATATVASPGSGSVQGDTDLTAFLCENPWPTNSDTTHASVFPFTDNAASAYLPSNPNPNAFQISSPFTNFGFSYCRDNKDLGLLPELTVVQAAASPNPDIKKEMLFIVGGTGDALGVRVLANEDALPIGRWYAAQDFTSGASAAELDSYEALQSGTTLYVSAANSASGSLYPNIYVISYNEDASDISQAIFDQVLDNWIFNANTDVVSDYNVCAKPDHCSVTTTDACLTSSDCPSGESCVDVYTTDTKTGVMLACEWDEDCRNVTYSDGTPGVVAGGYCDGEKAKLRRDLTRLTDLRDMELTIEEYGETHRHCSVTKGMACGVDGDCPGDETCTDEVPTLPSGSFVREFTTSLWPSWSAVLGNALGLALPVDPINEFINCPAGSDATTCFDEGAGTFECPAGSHAYVYQNIGGEAYRLSAQTEYAGAVWTVQADTDPADNRLLRLSSVAACDGMTIGDSAICGDGVLGADNPVTLPIDPEICEIGQTISDAELAALAGYSVTSPCNVCVNDNETDYDGIPCTYPTHTTCGTTGTAGVDYFCAEGATTYACAMIGNACDWDDANASECIPYECGNGVVDPHETCDDGALNGAYGYCDENCSLTGAFFCGDGSIAGGEACDCGEDAAAMAAGAWSSSAANCSEPNGQYSDDYDASCAFDCSFPGPSCGDNLINDDEQCDGDFEQWAGTTCGTSDNLVPCETDDDCASSECGETLDGALAECGSSKVCVGEADAGTACTDETTCDSGVCSSFVYDLYRYRSCLGPETGEPDQCTWDDWSACIGGDQVCGNNSPEGDEECDDGNTENADVCPNTCKFNVCGDGYTYIGLESCDDGDNNGVACAPGYGETCVYCSVSCQFTTVTGAYCGDDNRDAGEEACDLSDVPAACFHGSTDPDSRTVGTETQLDCSPTSWSSNIGVCNGGSDWDGSVYVDFNGAPCLVGATSTSAACGETSETNGTEEGECVAYACAGDCGSSCPATYEYARVQVQSEEIGASKADEITLYSYLSGDSPDQGTAFIPACAVGTALTADVNAGDWDGPSVDVVFVTDLSGSMDDSLSGGDSRIEVTVQAETAAIESLFEAFAGNESDLRIGTVGYTNRIITGYNDGRDPCVSNTTPSGIAWIDSALGSTESEIIDDSETGISQYPSVVAADTSAGTTTAGGLMCAHQMLSDSEADRKIIILMSDGNPSSPYNRAIFDIIDADEEFEALVNEVAQVHDDIIADEAGIEIYTAALTSSSTLKSYMAHWSSDTCGDSELGGATGLCSGSGAVCAVADDCTGRCVCGDGSLDGCEGSHGITCDVTLDDTQCNATGYCQSIFGHTGPRSECASDSECSGICQMDESQACVGNAQCPTMTNPMTGEEEPTLCNRIGMCEFLLYCDAYQTCDDLTDPYVDTDDCGPTDAIEYAYAGSTAEALSTMYTSIIETILEIRLTFTYTFAGDTVTTDGSIMEGNGVILPFPAGFACDGSEQEIPLRLTFDGAGSVTLSNLQLKYCPND